MLSTLLLSEEIFWKNSGEPSGGKMFYFHCSLAEGSIRLTPHYRYTRFPKIFNFRKRLISAIAEGSNYAKFGGYAFAGE